jgi:hypothetical protein
MSEPPDLESLARKFLDLWQDQMTAVAADPETADMITRFMAMMTPGMGALLPMQMGGAWAGLPPAGEEMLERIRAAAAAGGAYGAAAGAAPDAAASGRRRDDLDELSRRLARLEQRLDRLEKGPRANGGDAEVRHRGRRQTRA